MMASTNHDAKNRGSAHRTLNEHQKDLAYSDPVQNDDASDASQVMTPLNSSGLPSLPRAPQANRAKITYKSRACLMPGSVTRRLLNTLKVSTNSRRRQLHAHWLLVTHSSGSGVLNQGSALAWRHPTVSLGHIHTLRNFPLVTYSSFHQNPRRVRPQPH